MSNTDRDSMLERWADGMEKLEQYYEGIYGPPATPPQLPPITTKDAMLEAIADGMERAKRNINKKSTTYHSDSAGYTKVVPAGDVHYASLEQIGGRTLVWNQLADFSTITNGGTYAFTIGTQIVVGHTYYFSAVYNGTSNYLQFYARSGSNKLVFNGQNKQQALFVAPYGGTSDGTTNNNEGNIWMYVPGSAWTSGDSITDIQLTDLTLMFGSGNEPSTVAEYEAIIQGVHAYNNGTLLSADVQSVVSKDANAQTIDTYSIPSSIKSLSGYGWSAGSVYNEVDLENKKYIQRVGSRSYTAGDESDDTVITDKTTTYYPLNPAVETDISAYLTDDNLIEVEAGGTLTFPNSNGDDYRIPVPSSETFIVGAL